MKSLAETGIRTADENGTPITLNIVPLYCPIDPVARPLLQNRLQYNGYFGCSWCHENGVYQDHAMPYPLLNEDAKIRTNKSHRKDYKKTTKANMTTVRGLKGFSVSLTLLTFDMVWGFLVDFLHSELLGVVKYLWDVWIETKLITPEKLRELNKRLLNMTPAHEIHRLPKTFVEKAT